MPLYLTIADRRGPSVTDACGADVVQRGFSAAPVTFQTIAGLRRGLLQEIHEIVIVWVEQADVGAGDVLYAACG